MANSVDPLTRLRDQIKCSICLDTYNDPKALGCHHAFCKQCLERLPLLLIETVDNEQFWAVKCPSCRIGSTLPEGGVSGFEAPGHVHTLLELHSTIQHISTFKQSVSHIADETSDDEEEKEEEYPQYVVEQLGVVLDALAILSPWEKEEFEKDELTARLKIEITKFTQKVIEAIEAEAEKLKQKVDRVVRRKFTINMLCKLVIQEGYQQQCMEQQQSQERHEQQDIACEPTQATQGQDQEDKQLEQNEGCKQSKNEDECFSESMVASSNN